MPAPDTRSRARPIDAPTEPLRRKRMSQPTQRPIWRRALNFLLVFVAVALLADALVGDRGLVATVRARRQHDDLVQSVQGLRGENSALRESIRRLREDPTTIEALARKELGLIRQGEVLVVIKDVKPSSR